MTRDNENAGVDLLCAKYLLVSPSANGFATLVDQGVKARMIRHSNGNSETCHYWLAPRSSIWKSGLRLANSLGVIDRS